MTEFKSKDKRGQYELKRKWYLAHKEQQLNSNKESVKKNPEKVKAYKRKYVENNLEKVRESKRKWNINNPLKLKVIRKNCSIKLKEKHPEKIIARNKARPIPLKNSCEICGSKEKLTKHHWRYDKPLLVNTLCKECHDIQHVKHFNESCFGRN
jgi:hypothetical protein